MAPEANQNKNEQDRSVPELDLNSVIAKFQERVRNEVMLTESEQKKILWQIISADMVKHLSETKLASGLLTRNLEKVSKSWDRLPKWAQYAIMHAFSTATSLFTGAYGFGITSPNGLIWRVTNRVVANTLLKGSFDQVATEINKPGTTRQQIQSGATTVKSWFIKNNESSTETLALEKNISTTGIQGFDTDTNTTTVPGDLTTHTATKETENVTSIEKFNADVNTTINKAGLDAHTAMKETGTPTGSVKFKKEDTIATDPVSLQEIIDSATREAAALNKSKSEKQKALLGMLWREFPVLKTVLMTASVGTVFTFGGWIVAGAAAGGMALKEGVTYFLKKAGKNEKNKGEQTVASGVTLAPTLNEKTLEIELDTKVLLKELRTLLPAIQKTLEAFDRLGHIRKGAEFLAMVLGDLGTESAHHLGGNNLNYKDDLAGVAKNALKRGGKSGNKVEKAKKKVKKEMGKEQIKASKNTLRELKIERTDKLDIIDDKIRDRQEDLREILFSYSDTESYNPENNSPSLTRELSVEDKVKRENLETELNKLEERKVELLAELGEIKAAKERLEELNISKIELQALKNKRKKIEELQRIEIVHGPLAETEKRRLGDIDEKLAVINRKLSDLMESHLKSNLLTEKTFYEQKRVVVATNFLADQARFFSARDQRDILQELTKEQVIERNERENKSRHLKELKEKRWRLRRNYEKGQREAGAMSVISDGDEIEGSERKVA